MIKSNIKIVVELEHAHQRFQRDAKYVTKVYCNDTFITSYPGDIASILKSTYAMDENYECTIVYPFTGRFAYKNNEVK